MTEKCINPAKIYSIYKQFLCICWEKHEQIDNIRIDTQKKMSPNQLKFKDGYTRLLYRKPQTMHLI